MLTKQEQESQELFYRRLSWLLDNPDYRVGKPSLSLEKLREYEKSKSDDIGKYIAVNERLSIPELVKRLVTYDKIADAIGMEKLKKQPDDPEFKDIHREAGYWTGWFMGDGDKVGDKLKELATRPENDENKQEHDLKNFTDLMREWGKDFQYKKDLFPQGKGRIIYAGGDDFLGVLYSKETKTQEKPEKVKPIEALNWLLTLEDHWKEHQNTIKQEFNLDFTYSVGFVWAGHQVPQRDILQHCREAEKRAKSLGPARVTLRVVFNSGQFVQWTCPWDNLHVLRNYRDRDGKSWGEKPNWTHIYNDWVQLKARHAIRLQEMAELSINKELALALFNLYFDNAGEKFKQERKWIDLAGDNSDSAIVNWIDDLVQVGWQLCRKNSNI